MKGFLVVGATGVAGTAGIRAIRKCFGGEAKITGLWYGRSDDHPEIAGADRVLYGDISSPETLELIAREAGERFDWCLFCTAMGDVGFPISDATAEQIAQSNRLSFDPILALEQRFEIGTIIAYSTFYALDHQQISYGAMGHSKHAIECWTVQHGRSRHVCLRAGAFKSASSQGIKLLVRRRAKELAESSNPLLRSFFADQKPSVAVENLEQAVFEEERRSFGDTGTDLEGLIGAHEMIFSQPDCVFVNVCGNHIWASSDPQQI